MLINRNTRIVGEGVVLIPYRKEHVLKYNAWMQSLELQNLTASEPLSLDKEYEMQESWMLDENKCTFIILDKETFNSTFSEIESMIGDTNLFFSNDEDRLVAEAEIMIAEPTARGHKRGWQAMILMLLYGIQHLGVKQFIVKIALENEISIRMFSKLGFEKISVSDIFKEITMSKVGDEGWVAWLKSNVGSYEVINESV